MKYLDFNSLYLRFLSLFNHANIKNFIELLNNKTVAIVGNAESLLEKKYGPEIDNHDIVIRFNKGFIINKEAQGSKTDIWACSLYLKKDVVEQNFPDLKTIIWITPKMSLMKDWMRKEIAEGGGINVYPIFEWLKLLILIKKRPTSGCILIDYIVKNADFKKLDIYGFDFFKTNSYYNKMPLEAILKTTPHNFDGEKEHILKLIKKNPNTQFHKSKEGQA